MPLASIARPLGYSSLMYHPSENELIVSPQLENTVMKKQDDYQKRRKREEDLKKHPDKAPGHEKLPEPEKIPRPPEATPRRFESRRGRIHGTKTQNMGDVGGADGSPLEPVGGPITRDGPE